MSGTDAASAYELAIPSLDPSTPLVRSYERTLQPSVDGTGVGYVLSWETLALVVVPWGMNRPSIVLRAWYWRAVLLLGECLVLTCTSGTDFLTRGTRRHGVCVWSGDGGEEGRHGRICSLGGMPGWEVDSTETGARFAVGLRACYAMSGTDLWRMGLPGLITDGVGMYPDGYYCPMHLPCLPTTRLLVAYHADMTRTVLSSGMLLCLSIIDLRYAATRLNCSYTIVPPLPAGMLLPLLPYAAAAPCPCARFTTACPVLTERITCHAGGCDRDPLYLHFSEYQTEASWDFVWVWPRPATSTVLRGARY
eukprot:3935167-Rhodomonas_salina.7